MKAIDAFCREMVVIRLSNEVSESGWPGTGHEESGPPLRAAGCSHLSSDRPCSVCSLIPPRLPQSSKFGFNLGTGSTASPALFPMH